MVSLPAAIAAIALSGVGQTVLLDFYGDYCPPCRAMQPTVQSLMDAGYPVQRINAEHSPLAAQYGVTRWPCFIMLVNGQEVDRVVGSTTYSRLEQMCKLGVAAPSPQASPALLAQNSPPAAPSAIPPPSALSAPFDGWSNPPAANQAVSAPAPAAAGVSDATLIAASVRLRVEDADGHSCGSGTIIDARGGEALILTCGHIFRDSKGKGKIEVDLLGPAGAARAWPAGFVQRSRGERSRGQCEAGPRSGGDPIARRFGHGSRGAARLPHPNGDARDKRRLQQRRVRRARHSYVTSLDKFVGAPNVQVAGQPVEGRSGGGLFSSEGYVIGVCNAADPSDKEGLFAALGSIYAELDRKDSEGRDLSFVYKSPSENRSGTPEAASLPPPWRRTPCRRCPSRPMAPPAWPPGTPRPIPRPRRRPHCAPHEQAALDEIHRRMKEGSDVTIVVHPRNDPDAKSEVFMLDHASREFVSQLSTEARRRETSLEVPKTHKAPPETPKPRRILLEWSADGEKTGGERRQPELMDASPRISPNNTIMR